VHGGLGFRFALLPSVFYICSAPREKSHLLENRDAPSEGLTSGKFLR